MKRTSVVGRLRVNAVIYDSIVQIGDNRYIQSDSKVLALQRERPTYRTDEEPFEKHPIFQREIPQLSRQEDLRMYKKDTVPTIAVEAVSVKSAAVSAVLMVGSNTCIDLTTRLKHIREFAAASAAPGSAQAASGAPPSARA